MSEDPGRATMNARFAIAVESELTVADLFAALGAAFREPSPALLERLEAIAARANLFPEPFRDDVRALWREAEAAGLTTLREAHAERFGHIPQSDAAPYETLYGPGEVFQQTAVLSDIAGFYGAFGVSVADERIERLDHIALELEFVGLLLHRTTCAPNDETCDIALAASRSFLTDHLGRWAPLFFRGLQTGGGFYAVAAALGERLLAWECERVGVTPVLVPDWPSGPPRLGELEGCATDSEEEGA